jgi:hypothetical protein
MTPAEQLALWADRLRDMAATGLKYSQNIYKFTFLCRPLDGSQVVETPSHAIETLEIGWFAEDALPDDLFTGHIWRIQDAYRIWRAEPKAHFDT